MADPKEVGSIVEHAVAEVFDQRLGELRAEVAKRVLKEIEPLLAPPEEEPVTAVLESCVASLEDSTSQADILRTLLNGAAKFSARVALFVVKGNSANGWECRGFDDDVVKKTSLGTGKGLAARALQDRTPVAAAAAEFDSDFVEAVGNPAEGNCLVVPLLVKEKVPALVYADAGTGEGKLDAPGVQLLVRAAGHWLEILAARKAAPAEKAEAEAAPERAEAPSPPPPSAAEPAAAAAGDQEVHKKAQKFAKLLVDELKLYNQAKVTEGRKHKDLYDRLKDDIDKSRATYEKRYGNTPAAGVDYFRQAIVKILAENDESLLGRNFPE